VLGELVLGESPHENFSHLGHGSNVLHGKIEHAATPLFCLFGNSTGETPMVDSTERRGITAATLAVGLAVIWMVGSVVYGVLNGGPPMEELTVISHLAWGKATFVDLFTGLLLFLGWVAYREKSWWHTLLWGIVFLFIANLGTSLYALIALRRSQNWREFWLGRS
jgi:hypothetical protein